MGMFRRRNIIKMVWLVFSIMVILSMVAWSISIGR